MNQRTRLLLITSFSLLVAACASAYGAMQVGTRSDGAATVVHTKRTSVTIRPVRAATVGQANRTSVSTKGNLPQLSPCPTSPTVEYIAEPQAGKQNAAVQKLGSDLLASLTLQSSGETFDLIRASSNLSAQSASAVDLSTFAPVLAQSAQPALRSCDMQLVDAPADASLVAATLQASVASGAEPDLAQAKAALLQAFVSDDPLDSADVIVTLEFPGAAFAPGPEAPVSHYASPFTAIEAKSGATVLASSQGGF